MDTVTAFDHSPDAELRSLYLTSSKTYSYASFLSFLLQIQWSNDWFHDEWFIVTEVLRCQSITWSPVHSLGSFVRNIQTDGAMFLVTVSPPDLRSHESGGWIDPQCLALGSRSLIAPDVDHLWWLVLIEVLDHVIDIAIKMRTGHPQLIWFTQAGRVLVWSCCPVWGFRCHDDRSSYGHDGDECTDANHGGQHFHTHPSNGASVVTVSNLSTALIIPSYGQTDFFTPTPIQRLSVPRMNERDNQNDVCEIILTLIASREIINAQRFQKMVWVVCCCCCR